MKRGEASRTAEYMALFRALESCRPPYRRLFEDPFAVGFLSAPMRTVVALSRLPVLGPSIPRFIDRRWPGPRVSGTVRTRVIDEALTAALADGAKQLVLLGAGYDSRPYRIEGAGGVRTFEVDHPDTQAAKRRRLLKMLPAAPANTAFVGIDFDREDLGAALDRAGYSFDEPTFFVWEGVTKLPHRRCRGRDLPVDLHPRSSRQPDRLHLCASRPARRIRALLGLGALGRGRSQRRRALHLRLLSGSPRPDYLGERGLSLLGDVSTTEALRPYRARLGDVPAPPAFYRVALAEVPT